MWLEVEGGECEDDLLTHDKGVDDNVDSGVDRVLSQRGLLHHGYEGAGQE